MEGIIRAAIVIKKDGKFLLVQEGHPKARGLWNWQQGKVEAGESIEETAVREAKEETGYDVAIVQKLGIIKHPFEDTKEIHVFLGEIIGGKFQTPGGEIMQARWFTLEELAQVRDNMSGPWVYETIVSSQG